MATAQQFTFHYAHSGQGKNDFVDLLRAQDAAAWIDDYPYDIRPATDDRPFFFQFGRWRDAKLFGSGWRENMLTLSGRLVMFATLVQALFLSLLVLVIPMVWLRKRQSGPKVPKRGVIVYFAAIGLSFMLLEVCLMQRFTLFFGHPVYAITVVLAVLLVFGGIGSFLSATVFSRGSLPWPAFGGLIALSITYSIFLPHIFQATLALSLPVRIAAGTCLLAPLGILLGIPFPAAVASLAQRGALGQMGLAWAANGCASVVGPLLAVMVAMDLGFGAVGWVAALGYAIAWATFGRWSGARRE